MMTLELLLDNPILSALGWTLVHFVWQGCLLGLMAMLVLRISAQSTANFRYLYLASTMLVAFLVPLITFALVYEPAAVGAVAQSKILGLSTTAASMTELSANGVANAAAAQGIDLAVWMERALPLIVLLWLVGVLALSGRLLLDLQQVSRLKRTFVSEVPAPLAEVFERLKTQMAVNSATRLLKSSIVTVPMVIGWLKPVVLLPSATCLKLSMEQLEMVLAHELAHVRRYDYLVNLLQTLVEILFFYHPVVKWISKKMREEREHCCDDVAVAQCNNAVAYARVLTDVDEMRQYFEPAVALTGTGTKSRVLRIVQQNSCHPKVGSKWAALGVLIAFFSAALVANAKLVADEPLPEIEPASAPKTSEPVVAPFEPAVAVEAAPELEPAPALPDSEAAPVVSIAADESVLSTAPVASESVAPKPELVAVPEAVAPESLEPESLEPESVELESIETVAAVAVAEKAPAQLALEATPELAPSAAQAPAVSNEALPEAPQVESVQPQLAPEPEVSPTLSEPSANAAPIGEPSVSEAVPLNAMDGVTFSAQVGVEEGIALETVSAGIVPEELGTTVVDDSVATQVAEAKLQLTTVTRDAVPVTTPQPKYPSLAAMRTVEQAVVVEFVVGVDGKVKNIHVPRVKRSSYFKNSIKEALSQWVFEPAMQDGKAVEQKVTKTFEFNLGSLNDNVKSGYGRLGTRIHFQ